MKKIIFVLISLQLLFGQLWVQTVPAAAQTIPEIKQKLLAGQAYIPYDNEEEKKVHAIIKNLEKKDQETVAIQYLNAARYYLEKSNLSSTKASTLKMYQKTAYIAASIAISYFKQGTKEFAEAKQILIKHEPSKLP